MVSCGGVRNTCTSPSSVDIASPTAIYISELMVKATGKVYSLVTLIISITLLFGCTSNTEKVSSKTKTGGVQRTASYYAKKPSTPIEQEWEMEIRSDEIGASTRYSSPSVTKDNVYFGTLNGYVYKIDIKSNNKVWKYHASYYSGDDHSINSSPTIKYGNLYVGDNNGDIHAIDLETGDKKWRLDGDVAIFSSPLVVDSTAYVGSNNNRLYAIDAIDGSVEWIFHTSGNVSSSPATDKENIYFGSGNFVYGLDRESGNKKWRFNTRGYIAYSTPIRKGIVYAVSSKGMVYALDSNTGQKKWESKVGREPEGMGLLAPNAPAVTEEAIYIGTENGLHALNIDSGKEKWLYKTEYAGSPVVVNNTIYFGSHDGLNAVNSENGTLKWNHVIDGNGTSTPVVVKGNIYFTSAVSDRQLVYSLN